MSRDFREVVQAGDWPREGIGSHGHGQSHPEREREVGREKESEREEEAKDLERGLRGGEEGGERELSMNHMVEGQAGHQETV